MNVFVLDIFKTGLDPALSRRYSLSVKCESWKNHKTLRMMTDKLCAILNLELEKSLFLGGFKREETARQKRMKARAKLQAQMWNEWDYFWQAVIYQTVYQSHSKFFFTFSSTNTISKRVRTMWHALLKKGVGIFLWGTWGRGNEIIN